MTRVDEMNPGADITYRVRNMFSPQKFGKFYLKGTTHFKTARYCLANCVIGKIFRYM